MTKGPEPSACSRWLRALRHDTPPRDEQRRAGRILASAERAAHLEGDAVAIRPTLRSSALPFSFAASKVPEDSEGHWAGVKR